MKDLQISLYDIFGYVAPGAMAFIGLYLLIWRAALSSAVDWSGLSLGGWAAFLLVSYILGHVVQAIGNIFAKIVKFSPETSELVEISGSNPEIYGSITNNACRVANIQQKTSIKPSPVYEIADSFILQTGKTECRDIYIYREGFYRGLMVSLWLFAVGAFAMMTGQNVTLDIFGVSLWGTPTGFGVLGAIALGISYLSFVRYRRFAVYRVRNAVFSFMAISKPPTP